MTRKKNADDQLSAEEQALQQRVYEMMELDRSKALKAAQIAQTAPEKQESLSVASEPEVSAELEQPEPIDIFKSLKTESPITEAPEETQVAETAEPEEFVKSKEAIKDEPVFIDDEAMDKVIDEIIVSESDALLAAEDIVAQQKTLPPKPKSKSTLGRIFKK